jgi:phenylpropionate dioxygenase-like ring-hydroxylating dioxygenase large terminal subunit
MLSNYWYIACTSRHLRRRPREVQVLSRNIVLFRTSDGTPAALENRCAHRGMPLAAGKVCGAHLQCPYHGWRYDSSGVVTAIPAAPDGGTGTTGTGISAYACREQDGYVWICPDGEPTTNLPPEFPNLGRPGWTTFRMYNRFEAPVESCLENFLDCPHATFVHRSWFRSPTNRVVRCSVQALDDGAVAEYFDEPREKSLVWSLLSPTNSGMRHTDRYIAPTTTRVDYIFSADRHYIITSSCTPVDKELTDVYTVITFRYKKLGPLIRLFFEPMSRRIIAQDVKTLRLQHRNLAKYDDKTFRVIQQDVLLPHIRRWHKSLREGRRPAGQQDPYDVDIVI